MVVADLHVHTTNSDGQLTLDRLPAAADAAGLDAVAVTDHDRPHPGLAGPVATRGGVTVIHGIELRVDAGDQRVDLLGYGVRPTDDLVAECERLQADRVERGRAIVECVEDRLGVDLDVTVQPGFGRPDVARAVAAHPETDYSVQAVFDDLIAADGPCYVARDVPTFDRGREVLGEACDLVGLAHPLRYGETAAALSLAPALDALEVHYPYGDGRDLAPVQRVARRHDLLVTGGSDAHEDDLGRAGLDGGEWDRVRSRLAAATEE